MNNKRVLASVAVCANVAIASMKFCATREVEERNGLVLLDVETLVVALIVPETDLTGNAALADDAKQLDGGTLKSWQSKTDTLW